MSAEQGLTPASKITLEYIQPSDALQPFITTLYYFRCDEREIRDIQPAAVGSLIVFLRGKGAMRFGDRADPSHLVSLLAPLTYAAPFEVNGPFHTIGASLSPLGWAALTGLKADEARDRMYNAASIFGEEITHLGENLRQDYLSQSATPTELCARLADFLAGQIKPVQPKHVEFMRSVNAWMSSDFNPDIAKLAEISGYSNRQVQRLVERYFGVTPKILVRKYRALRIVALLHDPTTTDEQVAELLNHFYDQSHLIREVRSFAGRTPARFGDSEAPILESLLDVRNFREIKPNVAPLPGE
ncbi:helix-turn-helix domain-containing protein [Altererythrobacter sp. MF3-039]|uniref:AraC family transcriptional regulator n=1 Tax=Altererythrobacter sp. MF3-039 TaxID=3252901 RepID=UPI00390CA5DD